MSRACLEQPASRLSVLMGESEAGADEDTSEEGSAGIRAQSWQPTLPVQGNPRFPQIPEAWILPD